MNTYKRLINYLMGEIKMDRKAFMRELEYLLQDISEDEKQEALSFYENYFDEAGSENEQKVIEELGDPSRIAAIIKDGLQGRFDEHISSGNQGFSSDDYQQHFEVRDQTHYSSKHRKTGSSKWQEMDSRDKTILCILAVIAFVPFSFSIIGNIFGAFGGLLGAGLSVVSIFFCMIFGFWIATFVLFAVGIAFIVFGVIHLFTIPGAGLIYMGVGSIIIALFGKMATWFFRDCIPSIVHWIGNLFHSGGEIS